MKKLYYSIGEVSEIASVEPHILRYWETIFDQLSPSKNSSGKRVYTEDQISVAIQLKELIQDKKYSTAGAKQFLDDQNRTTGQHPSLDQVTLKRDLNELKLLLHSILEIL